MTEKEELDEDNIAKFRAVISDPEKISIDLIEELVYVDDIAERKTYAKIKMLKEEYRSSKSLRGHFMYGYLLYCQNVEDEGMNIMRWCVGKWREKEEENEGEKEKEENEVLETMIDCEVLFENCEKDIKMYVEQVEGRKNAENLYVHYGHFLMDIFRRNTTVHCFKTPMYNITASYDFLNILEIVLICNRDEFIFVFTPSLYHRFLELNEDLEKFWKIQASFYLLQLRILFDSLNFNNFLIFQKLLSEISIYELNLEERRGMEYQFEYFRAYNFLKKRRGEDFTQIQERRLRGRAVRNYRSKFVKNRKRIDEVVRITIVGYERKGFKFQLSIRKSREEHVLKMDVPGFLSSTEKTPPTWDESNEYHNPNEYKCFYTESITGHTQNLFFVEEQNHLDGGEREQVILQCFMFPENFHFDFIDIGDGYAMTTNPFFDELFLIFYRGEIVTSCTATEIKNLRNGYLLIYFGSENYLIYKNKVLKFLLNWKISLNVETCTEAPQYLFYSDKFGRKNLSSHPKIVYWKDVHGSQFGKLLDGKLALSEGEEEEEEEKKVPKTLKKETIESKEEWEQQLLLDVSSPETIIFNFSKPNVLKHVITILADQNQIFESSSSQEDEEEKKRLQVFSELSQCLEMMRNGIFYYDRIKRPDIKFNQFCESYQKFMINLYYINNHTDSSAESNNNIFCHIPRDVLSFVIIPYFSQLEVFCSTNFEITQLLRSQYLKKRINYFDNQQTGKLQNLIRLGQRQIEVFKNSVHPRNSPNDILIHSDILISLICFQFHTDKEYVRKEVFGIEEKMQSDEKQTKIFHFRDGKNSTFYKLFHQFFVSSSEQDSHLFRMIRVELFNLLESIRKSVMRIGGLNGKLGDKYHMKNHEIEFELFGTSSSSGPISPNKEKSKHHHHHDTKYRFDFSIFHDDFKSILENEYIHKKDFITSIYKSIVDKLFEFSVIPPSSNNNNNNMAILDLINFFCFKTMSVDYLKNLKKSIHEKMVNQYLIPYLQKYIISDEEMMFESEEEKERFQSSIRSLHNIFVSFSYEPGNNQELASIQELIGKLILENTKKVISVMDEREEVEVKVSIIEFLEYCVVNHTYAKKYKFDKFEVVEYVPFFSYTKIGSYGTPKSFFSFVSSVLDSLFEENDNVIMDIEKLKKMYIYKIIDGIIMVLHDCRTSLEVLEKKRSGDDGRFSRKKEEKLKPITEIEDNIYYHVENFEMILGLLYRMICYMKSGKLEKKYFSTFCRVKGFLNFREGESGYDRAIQSFKQSFCLLRLIDPILISYSLIPKVLDDDDNNNKEEEENYVDFWSEKSYEEKYDRFNKKVVELVPQICEIIMVLYELEMNPPILKQKEEEEEVEEVEGEEEEDEEEEKKKKKKKNPSSFSSDKYHREKSHKYEFENFARLRSVVEFIKRFFEDFDMIRTCNHVSLKVEAWNSLFLLLQSFKLNNYYLNPSTDNINNKDNEKKEEKDESIDMDSINNNLKMKDRLGKTVMEIENMNYFKFIKNEILKHVFQDSNQQERIENFLLELKKEFLSDKIKRKTYLKFFEIGRVTRTMFVFSYLKEKIPENKKNVFLEFTNRSRLADYLLSIMIRHDGLIRRSICEFFIYHKNELNVHELGLVSKFSNTVVWELKKEEVELMKFEENESRSVTVLEDFLNKIITIFEVHDVRKQQKEEDRNVMFFTKELTNSMMNVAMKQYVFRYNLLDLILRVFVRMSCQDQKECILNVLVKCLHVIRKQVGDDDNNNSSFNVSIHTSSSETSKIFVAKFLCRLMRKCTRVFDEVILANEENSTFRDQLFFTTSRNLHETKDTSLVCLSLFWMICERVIISRDVSSKLIDQYLTKELLEVVIWKFQLNSYSLHSSQRRDYVQLLSIFFQRIKDNNNPFFSDNMFRFLDSMFGSLEEEGFVGIAKEASEIANASKDFSFDFKGHKFGSEFDEYDDFWKSKSEAERIEMIGKKIEDLVILILEVIKQGGGGYVINIKSLISSSKNFIDLVSTTETDGEEEEENDEDSKKKKIKLSPRVEKWMIENNVVENQESILKIIEGAQKSEDQKKSSQSSGTSFFFDGMFGVKNKKKMDNNTEKEGYTFSDIKKGYEKDREENAVYPNFQFNSVSSSSSRERRRRRRRIREREKEKEDEADVAKQPPPPVLESKSDGGFNLDFSTTNTSNATATKDSSLSGKQNEDGFKMDKDFWSFGGNDDKNNNNFKSDFVFDFGEGSKKDKEKEKEEEGEENDDRKEENEGASSDDKKDGKSNDDVFLF